MRARQRGSGSLEGARALFALCALCALCALVALSGCSLLNQPDRGLLDGAAPGDGATPDGEVSDGGMDGTVTDGCVPSAEEICDNDMDDDCDGLVDCVDFECAATVGCCAPGSTMEEMWSTVSSGWTPVPLSTTNYPEASGGRITRFNAIDPGPSGIVSSLCEPLAAGRSFTVRMRIESDCPTCFARFALTPAPNARPGELILDDLSVTLFGDGHLEAGQNRRMREATGVFAGQGENVDIQVDIVPGEDALHRAALVATVVATNRGAGGGTATLVESFPFVAQDVLLTAPGEACATVPGLNLSFEGTSAGGVSVGSFTRRAQECVNPSQFFGDTERCTTVMSESLTASGAMDETVSLNMATWASGGISAPALVAEGADWHLFLDGTNVDRALEDVAYIGYGVGHARQNRMAWCSTWVSNGPVAPKIAPCDSCLGFQGASCSCPAASVREPSVVRSGASFAIAYAVQAGARSDAHDIAVTTVSVVPMTTAPATTAVIDRSTHAPMCTSLRDPMIVAAGPETTDGFWVFFTCETVRPRSEIWAIHLDDTLDPGTNVAVPVLAPSEAGYDAGAVYAPEVIVEYDTTAAKHHVFRLWALARDATQSRVSVGVFQGQLDDQQAAAGDLPAFQAFGANPIITEEHSMFRDCSGCELLGMSVARVPGTNSLRVLVARRVNGGTDADYQLVPYEQYWKNPLM